MFNWKSSSLSEENSERSATYGLNYPVINNGKIEEDRLKFENKFLRAAGPDVLRSAVIDVRPSRAVHVTSRCRHGVKGGMCGATHCGLSAVLPLESSGQGNELSKLVNLASGRNSYPTAATVSASVSYPVVTWTEKSPAGSDRKVHYHSGAETVFDVFKVETLPSVSKKLSVDVSALDDILADVDVKMDSKTTTQWRSSFQIMREKFQSGEPPKQLKLAADYGTRTLPKAKPRTGAGLLGGSLEAPPTTSVPRSGEFFKPSPVVKSQSDMNIPTTLYERERNGTGTVTPKRSYAEVRQELLKSEYLRQPLSSGNAEAKRRPEFSLFPEKKKRVSSFWLKSVGSASESNISPPALPEPAGKKENDRTSTPEYKVNRHPEPVGNFTDQIEFPNKENPSYWKSSYNPEELEVAVNFSELNSFVEEHSGGFRNRREMENDYHSLNSHVKTSYSTHLNENLEKKEESKNVRTVAALADGNRVVEKMEVNFSALDSAVEAVQNLAAKEVAESSGKRSRQKYSRNPSDDVHLINEMSKFLNENAEIMSENWNRNEAEGKEPPLDLAKTTVDIPTDFSSDTTDAKSYRPALTVSHSPSPDASSATSDAPAGLPYLKPKHHLRETLQSMGLEPRSPTFNRSPVWSVSHLGSVAERIQQFEKFPAVQLKVVDASGAAGSLFGKSVATVYRTKPVIHVNLSRKKESGASNQGLDHNEQQSILSPAGQNVDSVSPTVHPSSSVPKDRSSVSDMFFGFTDSEKAKERKDEKRIPVPESSSQIISINNVANRKIPKRLVEEKIPRFYFPHGRPVSPTELELTLSKVSAVFAQAKKGRLMEEKMDSLVKVCDFPLYWKKAVFLSCGGGKKGFLTLQDFTTWWKSMTSQCHDEASRFVYTLAGPKGTFITREDLEPIVQDIVDTFPGLYFLRDAPEFHSRYIQTVIARMFYNVNRSWSGKISIAELRHSNFLDVLRSLQDVEDINVVTDYFSYEHFYVIYCKFWEIDRDHDLLIDKTDLSRHDNGVNRGASRGMEQQQLTYADFVSFLLAEEDKRHPTSIEYWFRCLDMDGDGVLSMYELQYFYDEQERKMMALSIEPMSFTDVLCQMFDIVRPREPGKIRLGDLKRCRMSGHFLNAFINVHKYYEQEASETERASFRSESGEELSDWDRFCAEEYEALMQEEQTGQETEINCDDSDAELEQYLSLSAPDARSIGSSMLDTL